MREDQAAAALSVLTDGQHVSVINAPAGSGKTRVLAEAARAWAAAGLGPVIGITPSQSARNTLAAWVPVSYNTAQFLGHLPGRRGARGPVPIGPGTLLVIDEASMISGPDLADLIAYAAARGAKIILAGDTSQLQAVENGGGMSLLAVALGYARLAEPVRFRAAWEQAASLRLRDGDTTVLADYDRHGRIYGGEPEQMIDAAAAAYVALTADGTDTLLMTADHALRRELSRRIRDDLISLGIVQDGPAVRIADGTKASPGDLIICTQNDHAVEAGEPGRTLANGDLLRIEAVTPDGLIVRRARDADPATGQRRWTDRHFLFASYKNSELGYAVTDHTAQSRTVHTGLTVITGTENRPHALVALTRGTDVNLAYVFTRSPKLADPVPGPRPAPELARYDRRTDRDRRPAPAAAAAPPGRPNRAGGRAGTRRPAAIGHPDPPPGPDRRRPPRRPARHLGRRDHPRPPPALPRPAPGHPAARIPRRTQPPGQMALAHPSCRRTRRPRRRTDPGRRDRRTGPGRSPRHPRRPRHPPPQQSSAPWSRSRPARGPRSSPPSPTPNAAPTPPQIAALMDARKDRIGEHAADHAPPWAVTALGPVPEHPLDRLDWQRRAASIGAWRELSGHSHPTEPDRPRARRGRPGPAGRLARGLRRSRPGRRPGCARHAGRDAAAPARHLPDRNRLGPPMGR